MDKKEVITQLKDYKITYLYDDDYRNIWNICNDYLEEVEDLFDDFITYEEAEEKAKYELRSGGLIRLYYFLGDSNCNNNLFRINGYGNLEDVTKEDIQCLIDEIIERLEESDE